MNQLEIYFPQAIAFLVALVACPLLAKFAPKMGLMDAPNHPRKTQKTSIPRVGGLAVALGIVAGLLLSKSHIEWPFWIGIFGMGLVGLFDDWWELKAWSKFLTQMGMAVFLWAYGIRITLFIPSAAVSLIFTILWFVWVVNAINYMDNSNGLCGGIGVITLGGLAGLNFLIGTPKSLQLGGDALLVLAALVGFLFWNFPQGKVFLGDHGSHFVGAAIAAAIMQTTFVDRAHGAEPWGILAVPFFVLIPLIDFFQVSIGRWKRGVPIWQADQNHLAHLLAKSGKRNSAQAVLILWAATILSVICGILIWNFSR